MTDITRADIERMIAVAEKATKGEWYQNDGGQEHKVYYVGLYDDDIGTLCLCVEDKDAQHVAQCSPDRIIPILRLALEALAVRESMAQLAESQVRKEVEGTIALVEDKP